ncbi:MAG: DUF4097 family beta strand repeat-containing protein [Gemmatimonadetes bacterium]|nr:DUF4097 family beta strand repeat-containing protein [Gemmatimonadota bacterium]
MQSRHLAATAGLVLAVTWNPIPTFPQQRRGEQVLSERFDIGPGGVLRVNVPDGDIEIETHGDSWVDIEVWVWGRDLEWAREVFERMAFEVRSQGNTVSVTARSARRRGSEYRRHGGVGLTVAIRIPRRFDADITTEDGDILLADLDGDVTLNSSDGDLMVGRIRGLAAHFETSDGDITVAELEMETTVVRTSDGDIDLRTVAGSVRASTSDGDIRITLRQPADVDLRTSDGDITIYAPPTLQANVSFDAEDLDIARSFTIVGRVSRRRVTGDMNGGGPRLDASTSDGSISLRVSTR